MIVARGLLNQEIMNAHATELFRFPESYCSQVANSINKILKVPPNPPDFFFQQLDTTTWENHTSSRLTFFIMKGSGSSHGCLLLGLLRF